MKKLLFFALITFGCIAYAADNDFEIWLSDAVVTGESVELNKEFMQAAGDKKEKLRESFKRSFKASFSNAVDKIDPKKRRSTAAAFLSIVRASKYDVNMEGSNVVLYTLPVTATINFVNISTGELLYSQTYTHIGSIEVAKNEANIESKIIKNYYVTTKELIDELAKTASKKFVPKKLQTKIIGIEHGVIVLDQGSSNGVVEGDSLDGDNGEIINVIYASQDYAIAKEELGKAKIGSTYTKTYSQSLEDIKKPKITLLDIQYNDKILPVPEEMMYQFFADKLSQKGSFTLLSINKNFYTAINALQNSANLGIRFGKRNTPDYFMRLYINGPYFYDIPTNVDYAKQRIYQATVCGEIVDSSARVLGSECQNEKIEDEIKFGKAYSKEARFQVLSKNAIGTLAEKLSAKISFEPISYKVISVKDDKIEIEDDKHLLSEGANITVFKNLGNIGGEKDVFAPIMEAVVESKNGDKVLAKEIIKTFNEAPSVKKGDMIFESVIKTTSDTSKLFSICATESNSGGEKIEGFEEVSKFLISQYLKYPFYDAIGLQSVIDTKISDTEFEKVPKITAPKTTYCLNPVYRYTKISENISTEHKGYKEITYNAIAGVKEFAGSELKSKFALGGKITEYAPSAFAPEYMHLKLLESSIGNFEKSMQKLEIK